MRFGSPPKLAGVLVDPGDGAAHLLGHRHQVAAGLIDIDEVEHDEVRAGVHITARRRSNAPWHARPATRRRARTPCTGAFGFACREDIEAFDWRRAIGKALGFAEALPHKLAVARCGACQAARRSAHRPPGRRRRRAPSGPCSSQTSGPFSRVAGADCASAVPPVTAAAAAMSPRRDSPSNISDATHPHHSSDELHLLQHRCAEQAQRIADRLGDLEVIVALARPGASPACRPPSPPPRTRGSGAGTPASRRCRRPRSPGS